MTELKFMGTEIGTFEDWDEVDCDIQQYNEFTPNAYGLSIGLKVTATLVIDTCQGLLQMIDEHGNTQDRYYELQRRSLKECDDMAGQAPTIDVLFGTGKELVGTCTHKVEYDMSVTYYNFKVNELGEQLNLVNCMQLSCSEKDITGKLLDGSIKLFWHTSHLKAGNIAVETPPIPIT